MAIATVNPATGETVKTYDEMSDDDVERCLAAAAAAHATYRLTSFEARAGWMRNLFVAFIFGVRSWHREATPEPRPGRPADFPESRRVCRAAAAR